MRAYIIIDELVILFYNIMWKKKQAPSATRKPAVHGACTPYVCNNYYGNSVKRMIFLREFKYNK